MIYYMFYMPIRIHTRAKKSLFSGNTRFIILHINYLFRGIVFIFLYELPLGGTGEPTALSAVGQAK